MRRITRTLEVFDDMTGEPLGANYLSVLNPDGHEEFPATRDFANAITMMAFGLLVSPSKDVILAELKARYGITVWANAVDSFTRVCLSDEV
jgi:hypothetical protein